MICLGIVGHTTARAAAEPPRLPVRNRKSQPQIIPLSEYTPSSQHPISLLAATMAAVGCAMRVPTLPRALKTPLAHRCCRSISQLSIRHLSSSPGIASNAPSFEIRKISGKQDEPHQRPRRRIEHRLPDGSEDMTGPPGSARRAEVIQYTVTKGEPRYSRFTPDAWVKDSVLELCRNELPAELRADPLSYFESNRDNLDVAGRCLNYYIVWHHHGLSSRSQVRDRFQKDHAGQRALLWFIDNSVFRNTDLKLHPRFLRGLVHCLVAEEASERVTDFIRLAPIPDLASKDPFITKLVQPRTPNEAARLYTTANKASWVLYKQQKIEDAKALLEHAFDEFPDVFRRRHQAIVPQEGMWDAGAKKFKNPERARLALAAKLEMQSTECAPRDKAAWKDQYSDSVGIKSTES